MTGGFFGIGAGEILLLVALAVVMFGPERIPEYSRKVARVIYYLRNIANSATHQLKQELGPEYQDLTLQDLNPKTFLKKQLDVDLDDIQHELNNASQEINAASAQAGMALDELNSSMTQAQAVAVADPVTTPHPHTPGATLDQWGISFDPEST